MGVWRADVVWRSRTLGGIRVPALSPTRLQFTAGGWNRALRHRQTKFATIRDRVSKIALGTPLIQPEEHDDTSADPLSKQYSRYSSFGAGSGAGPFCRTLQIGASQCVQRIQHHRKMFPSRGECWMGVLSFSLSFVAYYDQDSTILPWDFPLSISSWARRRLAALTSPKVWASVDLMIPSSTRSAISFRIRC
jgi:hypothetical protein